MRQHRAGSSSSSSSHTSYADSAAEDDPIRIVYASETGNAQDAAERLGREIRRNGLRCMITSMEDFDITELPHIHCLIVLTSTHGRGQPPPAMLPLWTALLRSNLPDDILEDVNFALYGLGDSSYEKFCFAGKILARRLLSLGAKLIGSADEAHGGYHITVNVEESVSEMRRLSMRSDKRPAKDAILAEVNGKGKENENGVEEVDIGMDDGCLAWGDERAPDGIEETFLPWIDRTITALKTYQPPTPANFPTYPSASIPPPLYRIVPIASSSSHSQSHLSNGLTTTNGLTPRTERKLEEEEDALEPGWTWARLDKNVRVTAEDWFQDVREIELTLEEQIDYPPGSIASIRPETSDEEVDTFLRYSELTDRADEPIHLESANEDQPLPRHLPKLSTPTTLRRLLKRHMDLRSPPRKSFFEWLRRFAEDEREIERLDEFIEDPDEIHTYATRPRRSILETMADFRGIKIPLSHMLEVLPPLRRRQFSIASSASAHPGKVQLLIALVDYKTNLKVRRRGLLSSWLRDLPLGARIPIKLDEPTLFLPKEVDRPVILVGPGTGVAPMRAFVEERINQGAAKNTAIYFGCRSKDKDLYFAKDMRRWEEAGVKVRVACSRDQDEKLYVQHLIKEDASMIKEWVVEREGNIYISGSSNAMPKAVRRAVAESISASPGHGIESLDDAERYVEEMFESGSRGGEESW